MLQIRINLVKKTIIKLRSNQRQGDLRFRSDPEKVGVSRARTFRSTSGDRSSSRRWILSISGGLVRMKGQDDHYYSPSRSLSPGKSTRSLRGSRLKTASSRSNGLLVAPMTMTLPVLDVFKPSISCMNSVMTPRCTNPPPVSREDDRAPKRASISSIKTTQGANLLANENTERTSFSPSPTYF